ncbi:MAG: hypothetical protein PHO63_05170 [Bacilli bacterium]|nr:hypothetical protein [Bacilli bacterium]MDD4808614.1 hypothetical protein [Bacilli bacterium]
MKCSKCGSPLIPGENFCKICGYKVNVRIEPEIEIIDFESANTDVINPVKPIEENLNIMEEVELSKAEPVIDDDIVWGIDIEKDMEVDEILNSETKKKTFKLSKIMIFLVGLILTCSVGLNTYLFISNSNDKAKKEDILLKKEPILDEPLNKEIVYNSYLLNLNSNWKYEIDDLNNLLFIYDKSEDWGLSIQIVEEVTYDLFVNHKQIFIDNMKGYDFHFTSSYDKVINGREMYLYKGKNGEYTTYLILTKISDLIIGINKLMFQAEVDDRILNSVLNMNSSINPQTLTSFKNSKFNFTDLSGPIIEENMKLELEEVEELEENE